MAPAEVNHQLLDDGSYVASVSTAVRHQRAVTLTPGPRG